jgi:hypothetical protein
MIKSVDGVFQDVPALGEVVLISCASDWNVGYRKYEYGGAMTPDSLMSDVGYRGIQACAAPKALFCVSARMAGNVLVITATNRLISQVFNTKRQKTQRQCNHRKIGYQ